jgi:hypothetical protein
MAMYNLIKKMKQYGENIGLGALGMAKDPSKILDIASLLSPTPFRLSYYALNKASETGKEIKNQREEGMKKKQLELPFEPAYQM